jgi:pantoate--beta-alanine ligase
MEGKFRKGHFNGVAQIVSKLFKIVTPDNVYFGRKDFQQLVIVKYLNNKYLSSLKINVVSCDTIREPDGLAMSSRNLLLTLEQRKSASNISKYLFFIKENYSAYTIEELKIKFIEAIQNDEILKPEYIEIVDNDSLKPVETIIPSKTTLCVAVYCGKIRLIDNISF